jgi:hypothetical protein
MIQARIYQGGVEVQDPIPEEWEGQPVKILLMTPDDPLPALEARLAALHAMGAMEFEPGERDLIAGALAELDRMSIAAMRTAAETQP